MEQEVQIYECNYIEAVRSSGVRLNYIIHLIQMEENNLMKINDGKGHSHLIAPTLAAI